MITKKTVQILAAALIVCSAFMLPFTPASAAQDMSANGSAGVFYTDEQVTTETSVDTQTTPPATVEETTVASTPEPVAPVVETTVATAPETTAPVVETTVASAPETTAPVVDTTVASTPEPAVPVVDTTVASATEPTAPVTETTVTPTSEAESSLPSMLIAEAEPPPPPPADSTLPPPPLPPESPPAAPADAALPPPADGFPPPPGPFPHPPGPHPPPPPPPPPPQPPRPHYDPYNPFYPYYQYGYRWYSNSWVTPYYRNYPIVVVPSTPAPVYAPVISSFTANPSYIQPGQSSTLSWTVSNTANISISPSVGSVPNTGVYVVTPAYTTTYTLSASNSGGTVVASTTVTVAPYIGSTYYTSSTYSGTTATASTTDQASTAGSSNGTLSWWLPYLLLVALLAAATIIIVILLLRKPAAQAVSYSSARAGTMPAVTSPVATLPATGSPKTTPVSVGPQAKFVAPNGSELSLAGDGSPLGRRDFQSMVAPDKADLISRQHITVSYENGQYYIEDRGSTNGTRLNGSSIKGTGRQALKDGDTIDLAGALSFVFRS